MEVGLLVNNFGNTNHYASYSTYAAPQMGLVDTLKDDMSSTLRSVRDTLSTSFQTLNLTLMSMQNTLRTMSAGAYGNSTVQQGRTYIPSAANITNIGSMSPAMASVLSNSSTLQLAMGIKPYNVSPMEWAVERDREMRYRVAGIGTDASFTLGSLGLSGAFATYATNKAVSAATSAGLGSIVGNPLLRFGLGMGAMGVAGAVLDPAFEYFRQHADIYGRDVSAIKRMSPRMGSEFNLSQARQAASSITRYGYDELWGTSSFDTRLGSDGYRNVMMQGLQANMFQGKTPEELQKQMDSAARVVRFLTGILGSKDVNEAMGSLVQLKQMGLNVFQNSSFASQMGMSAYKYGAMMGVSAPQVMNAAVGYGNQVYSSLGLPSFGGVMPMMQAMAMTHEMEKRRMLSPASLSVSGGHMGVAQAYIGALGGMMSNNSIGGVMLAASMGAGGQFDASKFANSASLGYMGMLGQASQIVDPSKYAKFIANRSDLHAGLSQTPGLGDKQALTVLRMALQNTPIGTNDVNQVAAYLMTSGMVPNEGAAKQMAYEIVNPGLASSMVETEANRYGSRALHSERKMRNYGMFGSVRKGIENIGRIPESLDYLVGTKVGQSAYNVWSKLTGQNELDDGPSIPGVDLNLIKDAFSTKIRDREVNTADFTDAWRLADQQTGGGGNRTGFFGASNFTSRIMDLFGANIGNNTPGIEALWARNAKDYYEAMARDNTSASEVFARTGGLNGSYNSVSDMLSGYKSSYGGTMRGGLYFVADKLSNDQLNSYASQLSSVGVSNYDVENILKSKGINENDIGRLTKDQILELVRDSSATTSKAKGLGISSRQYAYLAAQNMGSGELSNYGRMHAAGDKDYEMLVRSGAAVARAAGDTFSLQEYSNLSNSTLGIGESVLKNSLGVIGLDFEDITRIRSLDPKERDNVTEAYADAITKIQSGNMQGINWDVLKKDRNLYNAIDKLTKAGGENLSSSIVDDKYLGTGFGGLLGRAKMIYTPEEQADAVKGRIKDLMAGSGDVAAQSQINDVFKKYFGFSDDDVSGMLANKNDIAGYLRSMKGGTDAFKAVNERLNAAHNELSGYGDVLKKSEVDVLKEKYGLTGVKSNYKKDLDVEIANSILGSSITKAKEQERDDKEAMGPYAKLVDQAAGAWKVVNADAKIDDARKKVQPETFSITQLFKPGNANSGNQGNQADYGAYTSGSSWSFTSKDR